MNNRIVASELIKLAKSLVSNELHEQKILDLLQKTPEGRLPEKDLAKIIPDEKELKSAIADLLHKHKVVYYEKNNEKMVRIPPSSYGKKPAVPFKKVASELVKLAKQMINE